MKKTHIDTICTVTSDDKGDNMLSKFYESLCTTSNGSAVGKRNGRRQDGVRKRLKYERRSRVVRAVMVQQVAGVGR